MPFLQDRRVVLSVGYLFPVIIQFCKEDRRGDRNFLENAPEMWELNEYPHWDHPLKQTGQGGELPCFMVSKSGVGLPPGTSDQRTRPSRQWVRLFSCRMVWWGFYFVAHPEAEGIYVFI